VINPQQAAQATTQPEAPIQTTTPGSGSSNTSTAAVAAKVTPAIVDINTTVGTGKAAGTGMIISSTGEILTNNHVVTGSTSITVTVQGRSQAYTAHVVGVDISQDVAVIQIDGNVSGLPTVTFANSSSLQVGDPVVALGNALGQGGTPHATQGQITSLNQTITASEGGGATETLNGMIESDAVIYEGDSGGALINKSGQVVGMITAGQAQGFRSSASDVGYAVASNTAVGVANRIRAHEQAADLTYGQVGYLGVSVQSLDSYTASQLGLSVTSGALVIGVPSGSPAASAGITRNSVITKLGGTAITTSDSLGTAIRSHKQGDSVSVTWVNTSGSHTATVTLGGVNP
jgi:S1-C subfamily serine protease